MLEMLIDLDRILFFYINIHLANPLTDFIMPLITNNYGLRIIYGLAMLLILWKGDAKMRWLVLGSALVLLFSDQITAGYLKNLIGRLRPCHVFDHEVINLLVGCGGGKSMPSAHASNAFGQAVLFSLFYKKARPYLFTYAILIALSRVFVGVHYPLDITIGALIGTMIALGVGYLFNKSRLGLRK